MKRWLLVFAACWSASAQSDVPPLHAGSLIVSGSILERYELWDWFPPSKGQNTYSYSGSLLQLTISQKRGSFDWSVDFASPILLNLPDRAVQPAPLGQLGLGGNYFAANDNHQNVAGFFAKQAYLRLKNARSSIQLGRFEFAEGMEGKPKDPTLAALKATRIQQHLIGTFGFSDVRRSFDGAHYQRSAGGWNVTAVTAIPTRGVFQVNGWGWVKTPFAYAALTRDSSRGRTNREWRVFGIDYNDVRPLIKSDNRSAAARATDLGGIHLATFGGHYIQDTRTRAGIFDLLAWGSVQTGKWGQLTQNPVR